MQTPLQTRADSVRTPLEMLEEKEGTPSPSSILSTHLPFRNLDSPPVLQDSMAALSSPFSQNFILDFGDTHAHVAFDLPAPLIDTLLKTSRPDSTSTRWINIWYPFSQRSVLEMLGQHYDFSPRLLALMSADPRRPQRDVQSSPYAIAAEQDRSLSDLESGGRRSPSPPSCDNPSLASGSSGRVRAGNLYDIVDEVWHYSSMDQGRSYLCLGFNSLYSTSSSHPSSSELEDERDSSEKHQPLPNVKRIWTWLLLLADRTVVTITEDPFPYTPPHLLCQTQQRILLSTRQNLTNVFHSLSKAELHFEDPNTSPLTLLPIRKRLGSTREETIHRTTDAPGLLFYYLFENWENSYSLVTRGESRYGLELQRVRREMFHAPKLAHIDRLDQIGWQLMVLKRHYKAYLRLIERVVEPQRASVASLANSRVGSKASRESLQEGFAVVPAHGAVFAVSSRTGRAVEGGVDVDVERDGEGEMVVEAESLLGVGISSAARVRFERLRDMISLYALSECKDYLHQKESLVQTNFQLIAIKESVDVERLTRAAFLISKATVLFLPVSFMTSYFSADFGMDYTIKTYWITFVIVLVASWLVLVGFGAVSGTMESWKFFPGVRDVVNWVRRTRGERKVNDGRFDMGLRSISKEARKM